MKFNCLKSVVCFIAILIMCLGTMYFVVLLPYDQYTLTTFFKFIITTSLASALVVGAYTVVMHILQLIVLYFR